MATGVGRCLMRVTKQHSKSVGGKAGLQGPFIAVFLGKIASYMVAIHYGAYHTPATPRLSGTSISVVLRSIISPQHTLDPSESAGLP